MFTKALQRHVECPADDVTGSTVAEVLAGYFERHPGVRHYVVDDQGQLRKHVAVFVGGEQVHDRRAMSDPVAPGSEVYVMQALSGGAA